MKYGGFCFVVSLVAMVQRGASQAVNSSAALAAVIQELEAAVPACALPCFFTLVPESACDLTDTECICNNADLATALGGCLLAANCTATEQLKTLRFQKEMCGAEVRDDTGSIKALIWTLYSVALIFVISRLLAHAKNLTWRSWDDLAIAACLLALTPTSVIAQMMVEHGLGRDIWMLEPDSITNTLFYFFIEEYLYTFLVVFNKISILCLYLRIFTVTRFRLVCYIFICIVGAFGISCWVSTGFNCTPITFMWQGWDGEHAGTCFDISKQTFALAIVNITFDVIIFVLPIPQLLKLQMTMRRKLGVISMFAVGLFVTICSVIRLQTIVQFGNTTNPTYDYSHLAVWSLIEIDVGVICACMPGMASLFKRMWPKVFGTTQPKGPAYQTPSSKSNDSSGFSLSRGKRGFSRMGSGKNISKTTSVTVSFAETGVPQHGYKSADELELVDRHAQAQEIEGESTHSKKQSMDKYEPGAETRTYAGKW